MSAGRMEVEGRVHRWIEMEGRVQGKYFPE